MIADIVRAWVPLAWEAFEDYRLGARTFSRQELAVLRRLLRGEAVADAEAAGLSEREWRELRADLGLDGAG